MRIWLLLFGLIFFFTNVNPQSERLENFQELLKTLQSGKQVFVIAYYAKCKLIVDSTEIASPDAIGGMRIN